MNTKTANEETSALNDDWLEIVRQQISSMRFGAIQIVVHESRVVQIERTEKLRLDSAATKWVSLDKVL